MKLNQKPRLMAIFALIILLCQVDISLARPTRGNRKNKLRERKTKRVWSENAVSSVLGDNVLNPDPEILFSSLPEPNVNVIVDLNEAEPKITNGPTKTLPNKWLDLERTLPEAINVPLNSDLTLECVAVGSPPPRVYWLKDGKPLAPFDASQMANHVFGWDIFKKDSSPDFSMANVKSKLPLKCLRPEDQGEYTCVAENDERQVVATTVVTVDDYLSSEPKSECLVQYTKKGKRSQQAFIMTYEYLHMETIGKDVMLSCHAGGRPRPTVSWTDNDGNAIYNGKKFWLTDTGNLVIKNLSWREMGEYTCRAENEFGSDSASTFLYPLLAES